MRSNLKRRVRNQRDPSKGKAIITVLEAVINSIQAFPDPSIGHVKVTISHETIQTDLNGDALNPESQKCDRIHGFTIEDDAIGFNRGNYDSFHELDSDHKVELGCKGIGRVTWLVVFDHVDINSWCEFDGKRRHVSFRFDAENEFSNEVNEESDTEENRTVVKLVGIHERFRKDLDTNVGKLAETVLEHCLAYLVTGRCPDIVIEDDRSNIASVNDLFNKKGYIVTEEDLTVKNNRFSVKHLLCITNKTKSGTKVSYCADFREVESDTLFKDVELTDGAGKHFSYTAYISGNLLDENVSTDRTSFLLPSDPEPLYPDTPSISEIRQAVADRAKVFLSDILDSYRTKRDTHIAKFIESNPQFSYVLKNSPGIREKVTPSMQDEEIYRIMNGEFSKLETRYVFDFKKALADSLDWDSEDERTRIFEKISETQKAALAKYMSHRKWMIDLYERTLRSYMDAEGNEKYRKECDIHDILMPRRASEDGLTLDNCNLWMIDERLCTYAFSSAHSDKPLSQYTDSDSNRRPDICIFSDNRGDAVHAVTIIEVKRPDRDDDEALEQVLDYVNALRNHRIKDYHGRPVKIWDDAVFRCYILCDIDESGLGSKLVRNDFLRIYDGRSYYKRYLNMKTDVEFVDFDHLLKDMRIRNGLFFKIVGNDTASEDRT